VSVEPFPLVDGRVYLNAVLRISEYILNGLPEEALGAPLLILGQLPVELIG
jgi:hypothetical protein